MLIFVIEDDPDWQSLYRSILEPAHTLRLFSDGVSAMQAIDKKSPDAILLDMLLTGPSGASLLAELQSYSDTAGIPVALISGVTIDANLSEYGVTAVFNKATLNPKDLLSWVDLVS